MANTARRLLCLWVKPTLFAALEERAREHDLRLDDEVRDILEATVARRRGRLVLMPGAANEVSPRSARSVP
jgi:plasmid stability protein